MKTSITSYKVSLLLLLHSSLLFVLYHHDDAIFSEANRLVGKWKQMHYSSLLSTEELTNAFNLRDDLRSEKSNIILVWNPMFGQVERIGNVEDNGCIRTYDRTTLHIAKAVVFHFAEISDEPSRLPMQHRKESQRWIWWCLEPPWNTRFVFGKRLTPLTNIFNWTMTYRLDSDIVMSYAKGLPPIETRSVKEMIGNKTADELGIALISNCWSSSRKSVLTELQQYIKIDIRGKCTNNPLCRGECALETIKRYKFFFAFENSRCRDYVTEKFFYQGVHGGAVPVVQGPSRSDYEKFVPGDSFIHVDDFESVKELAEYLILLDEDDEKYGKYLTWRSSSEGDRNGWNVNYSSHWDTICEKIREPVKTAVVPDLASWWYGSRYTLSNPTFSVCSADSGQSGLNLQKYLSLGYTVTVIILFLISMKCLL